MKITTRYTIQEVLDSINVRLLACSELLSSEYFDRYDSSYERFLSILEPFEVTQKDKLNLEVKFSLSSHKFKYNYLLFYTSGGELVGFLQLQSPLDSTKYEIGTVILNLKFIITFATVDLEIIPSVDYSKHISSTSKVHKLLFSQPSDPAIESSQLPVKSKRLNPAINDLSSLYSRGVNQSEVPGLIRYSGEYLIGRSEGLKTNIYWLRGLKLGLPEGFSPLQLKSLFVTEEDDLLGFVDTSDKVYKVSLITLKKEETVIPSGSSFLGLIAWKDGVLYDYRKESPVIFEFEKLKVVRDEISQTVHLSKEGTAGGRLKLLLEKNNRSLSTSNLRSVSNSYALYDYETSGVLTCNGLKVQLDKSIKEFVPLSDRAFIFVYDDGEWELLEFVYSEEDSKYSYQRTKLNSEFYEVGKRYFKYLEKIARHRNSPHKCTPLPLAIKGNVLCSTPQLGIL